MSLYLGKGNSNNNILHITKGVTPTSAMKSGVLDNTVFHSDLPYLSLLDYTELNCFATYYDEGYKVGGATAYTGMYTTFIPSEYRDYFNNNYFILLEIATNNTSLKPLCFSSFSHTAYNSRAAGSKYYVAGGNKAFRSNTGPVSKHLAARAESAVCNSSYPYLVLDNENAPNTPGSILYQYPYISAMDPPIGKVKLYVFNISNGVYISNTSNQTKGIYINKTAFNITTNSKTIDLSQLTGVKNVQDSTEYLPAAFNVADIRYGYPNGIYLKLDKFNFEKSVSKGWEFSSSNYRTYINKITESGVQQLIDTQSSSKFLNYANSSFSTKSYNYYSPGNTAIESYSVASVSGFYVVYVEGSYTCNGITLSILPSYIIVNPRESRTITIAASSVGVTNYQGGVSWSILLINVQVVANTGFTVLGEISFSGNSYPRSGSVSLSTRTLEFS